MPPASKTTLYSPTEILNDLYGDIPAANTAAPNAVLGVAAFQYQFNGTTWRRQRTPNVFKVVSLIAGTAEATIWTPATGKRFRLMGFILTSGTTSTLTFNDGTAGTLIFQTRGANNAPIITPPLGDGILSLAANNPLTVTRGTSGTLEGVVFGTEE